LLRAAAELLEEAHGGDVSTRAVCERAGVQAPTLYHHFGSKDGLLRAVLEFGMEQYPAADDEDECLDPAAVLRRGWDAHVAYGLANPSFYVLLYGRIAPGRPCAITTVSERQLTDRLDRFEQRGLLRTSSADAARQIVAANVGVTLYLIGRPEDDRDLALSQTLRDNVLSAVLCGPSTEDHSDASGHPGAVAAAATALLEALDGTNATALSAGEAVLLTEWLTRLQRPAA
jgi:AcrR family transcriptional regulator